MKKAERLVRAKAMINSQITSSPVSQAGRFLFHAANNWTLIYSGKAERTILCKHLILGNTDVISDNWMEANKEKFSEDGEALTIKREFKNFPYWGLTPLRILKSLGQNPSFSSRDGANFITVAGDRVNPPEFLKCLVN